MSSKVLELNEEVLQVLNVVKDKDVKNIYLVACGGSNALLHASKYLLDREAGTIEAQLYSGNEFIYRNPKALGSSSIVILTSRSGETPETVAAAKFAKSKGALTIGVIEFEGSTLSRECDHVVRYGWIEDVDAIDGNYSVLYQLTLGILSVKEGNPKLQSMVSSLTNIQKAADKAKVQYEKMLDSFAEDFKDEKVIYTLASGANYGLSYSFAICTLMEMQWIHSHALHAGEYFHGPFEIIDNSVPVILFMGYDETRIMDERALDFTKKYGGKLMVLDAKEIIYEGVDEDMKGYLAPIVFAQVLWKFAYKLANLRSHPMFTARRYMTKIEY